MEDRGPGRCVTRSSKVTIVVTVNEDDKSMPWDEEERVVRVRNMDDAGMMIMSPEHWERFKKKRGY